MNTTMSDLKIDDANAELASLLNTLINDPVRNAVQQLVAQEMDKLGKEILPRLTQTHRSVGEVLKLGESTKELAEDLQNAISSVEVIVKVVQAEQLKLGRQLALAYDAIGRTQLDLADRLESATATLGQSIAGLAQQQANAKQGAKRRFHWLCGGVAFQLLATLLLLVHSKVT